MTRDPAREALLYAVRDAEQRVSSATNAIIRVLSGGKPWSHELTRKHRGELERATVDFLAATKALAMLDEMDREIGR